MAGNQKAVQGHIEGGLATITEYAADDRILPGSTNIAPASFPRTCGDPSINASQIAAKVVGEFNHFLASKDSISLATLFLPDGTWRDHLCLQWDLRTFTGPKAISNVLAQSCRLRRVAVSTAQTRLPSAAALDFAGNVSGVQFFVDVVTDVGSGSGVARLAESKPGDWKILSFYTVLEELADFPERVGRSRVLGTELPEGSNWLQRRAEERLFFKDEPKVLIIGAGQGGLCAAARLKMLNVSTLVVDRASRVGDSWRNRYSRLILHDPVWYDHMPYMPFPSCWPIFTSKDKIANFFEAYAECMELNIWTKTEILSAEWDDIQQRWAVTLRQDSGDAGGQSIRTVHPEHVVLATGASGLKNFPEIPGRDSFKGRLCHSSDFSGASPDSKTKRAAVIVGSCNSACDLAQEFHENGYDVTMVQRSSTCVISSRSIVDIALKGQYDEDSGRPTADADLLEWGTPAALMKAKHIQLAAAQNAADKATLSGLERAGFKVDMGPNCGGLMVKYLQRGGGYYIDVGACQMIIDGKIKIKQGHEVASILPDGVKLADNSILPADEIVFATGYQNMRTQARAILGDKVADRVQDVWGFDEEGEIRTMWRRSGQPGLWFMGGNLAMARYFSRILALQIKALVEGIASPENV